jgi:beta-glucosidase
VKAGDTAWVSFKITNTGSYDGDEVPQLYIRDEIASVARPVMELKSFTRLKISKGATVSVRMVITPDMLAMWNAQNKEVIEPGDFRIMVGASSKDLRWKGTLRVE